MLQSRCANKSSGRIDKSGVFHWLMQRVTAIALIPLPFWMILFFKQLLHATPWQVASWVSTPANSVFLAFLALAAVYHAVLGIQSVCDDYISSERYKAVTMGGVKLVLVTTLFTVFYALWQTGSIQ